MTDERPVRGCDVCGQEDDHPRHVMAMDDGTTMTRHMDCCRDEGCPTGVCEEVTAGAEDLRGEELLEHLTTRTSHGT